MGSRRTLKELVRIVSAGDTSSPYADTDVAISLLRSFGIHYVKFNYESLPKKSHVLIPSRIGYGYSWGPFHKSKLTQDFRQLAHSYEIESSEKNDHTLDVMLLDYVLAALVEAVLGDNIPCYVRTPRRKIDLSNIGIGIKAYLAAMDNLTTTTSDLRPEVIMGFWSDSAVGGSETTISRLGSEEGRLLAVKEALSLTEEAWPKRKAPEEGRTRKTQIILRLDKDKKKEGQGHDENKKERVDEKTLGPRHGLHRRLADINKRLARLGVKKAGSKDIRRGGILPVPGYRGTRSKPNHLQAAVIEAISADAIFPTKQDLTYKQVFIVDNFDAPPEEWGHGRIYNDIQQLGDDQRRHIFLGGKPTIELDIGSFHPRLCYHLLGMEPPSDPYEGLQIDGQHIPREFAKLAVNIALNVKSQAAAIMAVRRKCELIAYRAETGLKVSFDKRDYEAVTITLGERLPPDLESAARYHALAKSAKAIIDAIAEQHAPIEQFLFSSAWKTIHRVDSSICLDVMERVLRQDIPIISIHDSFIAPVEAEAITREAIIAAYQAALPPGSPNHLLPIVKVK